MYISKEMADYSNNFAKAVEVWSSNGGPPVTMEMIGSIVTALKQYINTDRRKALLIWFDVDNAAPVATLTTEPPGANMIGNSMYDGMLKLWESHVVGLSLPIIMVDTSNGLLGLLGLTGLPWSENQNFCPRCGAHPHPEPCTVR
jgi:hypothetical protein